MKQKPPFFSIVMPVYNVAPWLGAALQSLREQTVQDWECFAINDGSSDDSGALLDAFARIEPRLKVIHQPNRGVSRTRNRALELVTGTYVCFMDADDIAYPWWLALFSDMIQRTGADLVRSQFPGYRPYTPRQQPPCAAERVYTNRAEVLQWGWDTFCQDGYAWTFAIRRATIGACRFPEAIRLKEDVLFDLMCLPNCQSAVQSGVISYWYRRRRSSAVSAKYTLEEALRRIALYEQVEAQQRPLLQQYNVSIAHPLSMLLLYDLAEVARVGGRDLLPTHVRALCEKGLLSLEVLPWKWRTLLSLCAQGHPRPFILFAWQGYLLWRLLRPVNTLRHWLLDRLRRVRV